MPIQTGTTCRLAPAALLCAILSAATAIAAIVACVSWLLLPYGALTVLAVGCGIAGWQRHQRQPRGRMLAGGAVVLAIGFLAGATLSTQTRHTRQTAERLRAATNLKLLSIGMHAYYTKHGCFPPAATHDRVGKPLLSWRVTLLPFIGHEALYERFKLDEAWDSPHNRPLLAEMPADYVAPDRIDAAANATVYQILVGPGTAFDPAAPLRLPPTDFPGGPRELFLIVEAAQAVPWTCPEDLTYTPDQPLPALGSAMKYRAPPVLFVPVVSRGLWAADASAGLHWVDLDAVDEETLRGSIAQDAERE